MGALLGARGFEVIAADATDPYAPPASPLLWVPRRFETHDLLLEMWDDAPGVRAHYSLIRHDGPLGYALDHLLGVDIAATIERRGMLWHRLDDSAAVTISTAGGTLTCTFGEALEAAQPGERVEPMGRRAGARRVDVGAAIDALTAGREREAAANELCFGAAASPVPIEPAHNARIHRARAAAFIGFGAGHLIPHVDLWSADAVIDFSTAAPGSPSM